MTAISASGVQMEPPQGRALPFHRATRTEDAPHDLVERMRIMHVRMVAAVLNGEGLGRVAELAAAAVGGRVAIVVPRLGAAHLAPADEDSDDVADLLVDLERYVRDRLNGRLSSSPKPIVAAVPVPLGDETVGAVFHFGGGELPETTVIDFLHVAAVASLTDVAVRDAHSGVVQNLRGSLIEDLRARAERESQKLARRAAKRECDFSHGAVALCIEPTANRPGRMMALVSEAHPNAVTQQMSGSTPSGAPRILAVLAADQKDGPEDMRAGAKRLAEHLGQHGRIGVSSFYHDPSHFARAIHEAELMVEVRCQSAEISQETDDVTSATCRMLCRMLASHPQEVHAFYEDTVGPIVRYDTEHQTELLRTLEAYLDHNCNMNATAAAVFAHRHTIAYRLERIYQLSRLDPAKFDDREALGLGLKVYRMMKAVAPVC